MPKPLTVDHNKLWKILKEVEITDHLTGLLRNLYAGQEQQLELDMEQRTGSRWGKESVKAVYCHPAYLNYAEYNMQNAGLDEAQAVIKIARRNINNLRYTDNTHLSYGRKQRGTKELLDEGERGE